MNKQIHTSESLKAQDGECYIKRWHKNDNLRFSQKIFDINDPELLQTTEDE